MENLLKFTNKKLKLLEMALEISKDGGTTRPKILDKILKFRKVALIIAYIGAYLSAQWLFDPVNMEVTRLIFFFEKF